MGTTNILDLNNRLEKVEKGNVAQNSYTSLKNKPKINNVILTGNKSLADIGAVAAADLGELTDLTTTDKSSCVGAINELKSGLTPEEKFCVVNSNVVDGDNRFVIYKVGRIVFVTISYVPKSGAIVSDAVIASQFPIPAQAWQIFDGITQLLLDTDGSLKYWYPSDTTTLTRRDFTFSYVSAS